MNKSRKLMYLVAILALILSAGKATALGDGKKGDYRITASQLKEMLGDPNVIIIDVRDPVGWVKSASKILGAVREDPQNVGTWAEKYAREQTIVFYCA